MILDDLRLKLEAAAHPGYYASIANQYPGVTDRLGVPMARVALAWHWAKGVTAPLVGCSRPERVDDAVAALDVRLTDEDIAYLEEPYTAHELVGPLGRPGEKALAGTHAPMLTESGSGSEPA